MGGAVLVGKAGLRTEHQGVACSESSPWLQGQRRPAGVKSRISVDRAECQEIRAPNSTSEQQAAVALPGGVGGRHPLSTASCPHHHHPQIGPARASPARHRLFLLLTSIYPSVSECACVSPYRYVCECVCVPTRGAAAMVQPSAVSTPNTVSYSEVV